jgi:hypothetical protein
MATLAQFFDRWSLRTLEGTPSMAAPEERETFRLRMFPNEDVYLFVKRIDNSRVVRKADPKTKRACWRTIGTSCAVAIFLSGTLAPGVYNLLAGYKIQELRNTQQRLEAQRDALEFQESSMLTNENLQKIADDHNFLDPSLPQRSFYLEDKRAGAVAQVNPVPAATDSRP